MARDFHKCRGLVLETATAVKMGRVAERCSRIQASEKRPRDVGLGAGQSCNAMMRAQCVVVPKAEFCL